MISSLPDSEHHSFKVKNLNEMVKFCIVPKCRRVQLMEFFGEISHEACCNKCDFCLGKASVSYLNGNDNALNILSCLINMQKLHAKVTLHHLLLTYRGSKRKEILNKSFNSIPEFGKDKDNFSETGLKHFIQLLISESVIVETLRDPNEFSTTPYLICGSSKHNVLTTSELQICKYVYK